MAALRTLALLITLVAIVALLGGCSSQPEATPLSTPEAVPTSGVPATPVVGGGDVTPQGVIPTSAPSTDAGITEAKYRLLQTYANTNNLLYCDPDKYPLEVSPDQEATHAQQRITDLKFDPEIYQAILRHNNIPVTADLTPDQLMQVYKDAKKLDAISVAAAGKKYRFKINVGKTPDVTEGAGTKIEGLIDANGKISDEKKEDVRVECPICLAAGTLISTPGGPVSVNDLREGMLVWTVDRKGARSAQPIVRAIKKAVPASHKMVRLRLSDGRTLDA